MISYVDDSGPISWPSTDSHDPDSQKYYYISYRPLVRVSGKEYIKGVDVVVPSTANGCMYECIQSGISDALEPVWTTITGKTITDGSIVWKCLTANTRLQSGDSITASTWTGELGVTLISPNIIGGVKTGVKVTAVPANVKKFTITNTITIQRASGNTEKFDKSLVIPIKTL